MPYFRVFTAFVFKFDLKKAIKNGKWKWNYLIDFLLQVAVVIFTGYTVWQWTQHESFPGALGFCLLWCLLEYVAFRVIDFLGTLLMLRR